MCGIVAMCSSYTESHGSAAIEYAFLIPLPAIYTFSLLWCLHTTNRVRQDQPHHQRPLQASHSPSSSPQPELQGSTCAASPRHLSNQDVEKAGTELEFVTGHEFVLGMNTLGEDLFGDVAPIQSIGKQNRIPSVRSSVVWPGISTTSGKDVQSSSEKIDCWEFIRQGG